MPDDRAASSGGSRAAFGAAVVKAELALVEAFKLRALPLRGIFGRATGELHGEPVELTARTYGGDTVQYARIVTIRSARVDIGSLFVVPCALRSGALLSIDLVAIANRGFAVADLIQLDRSTGDHELMSARDAWFRQTGETATGELPAWCRGGQTPNTFAAWIEPRLIFDPPAPTTQESATDALVASYAGAFIRLAEGAAAADLRDRHAACLRDQRQLAPSRQLISDMFGSTFVQTFFAAVMYPDTLFG